jgi:hypothetical protein
MNHSHVLPTRKTIAGNDPVPCSPVKQQVMSKMSIEMKNPVDWLNVKHTGRATHFTSGYDAHRFKINFPFAGILSGNNGFLTQVALHFSTIGQAAITAVELYEGKYLLWANDGHWFHGDHTFTLPSGNGRDIDPELSFTNDLRLELVVSFGAPNHEVPEFVFHAAQVRFAYDGAIISLS